MRVLLAVDAEETRVRVRAALAAIPHVEVVAETRDGYDLLELARSSVFDVAVIAVNLPKLNGLAATATLLRENLGVRVLMLTADHDPEFVVEIIHSGARGCVAVPAVPAELALALQEVGAGQPYFGLAETVRYLRRYLPGPPCAIAEPIKALTAREAEVVTCISEGMTNRQISRRMGVAIRTVETHRERVMRKLDLPDSGALRAYASARVLLAEAAGTTVSTEG